MRQLILTAMMTLSFSFLHAEASFPQKFECKSEDGEFLVRFVKLPSGIPIFDSQVFQQIEEGYKPFVALPCWHPGDEGLVDPVVHFECYKKRLWDTGFGIYMVEDEQHQFHALLYEMKLYGMIFRAQMECPNFRE